MYLYIYRKENFTESQKTKFNLLSYAIKGDWSSTRDRFMIQRGYPECEEGPMDGRTDRQKTEILVSDIGWIKIQA